MQAFYAPLLNAITAKTQTYSYDANGNLISVNTGQKNVDGKQARTSERKLLWDEENRLLALNDNGYVSNYWYDAAGERTVKTSGDGEGVFVNGVLSGARTGTSNFTAYVNPYMVITNEWRPMQGGISSSVSAILNQHFEPILSCCISGDYTFYKC